MKYVFLKDKIIEEEKSRIPLATHALQYGTAVFDSVRGYWDKETKKLYLLKPIEHFKRLLNSGKILGWQIKNSPEKMCQDLKRLIKKNKPTEDIYVRPFIFQSATKLSPILTQDYKPVLAMYMIGLGDYLDTNRGLKGKVSSWRRTDDNAIPPRGKVCGLYVNSSLARAEAEAAGADEAIFLNQDGHVCEGSGENIFMVRNQVLITPPVCSNVLEGVTRASIIQIARDQGIEVVERDIDRSELYIADEVFLTGTACQVAYFAKIDNRKIGTGRIGPITKTLQKIYFSAVHGKVKKYQDWLVKI